MKKSLRLKTIVDLNLKNEQKALVALGKAQNKKQELVQQLENLQQYQQEYKNKFKSISEIGVSIDQLVEFRAFINKLGLAIEEQKKAIEEMEKELVFVRQTWESKHQKTKSIQKVCDSALAEEAQVEHKREQNEQDDRATRSGRSNGTRNA